MHSLPVGLDVWFLIGPFIYFHTSCVQTAKALVRLRGSAGSSEPSLVTYVISTIISWAGIINQIVLNFIVQFLPWTDVNHSFSQPISSFTDLWHFLCVTLTIISLASLFGDPGKQCRPRSSKDSDQILRMPRLICLHWTHRALVGFVMRRLKTFWQIVLVYYNAYHAALYANVYKKSKQLWWCWWKLPFFLLLLPGVGGLLSSL